jgi:ATP-binding cassette subfamily C protein LapB
LTTDQALEPAQPGSDRDLVLACLRFLAQRYDRPASPVVLTAGLALNEAGHLPFHQIESALEHIGVRAGLVRKKAAKLFGKSLPAILDLGGDRAVVLLEREGAQALIYDPERGEEDAVWMPITALPPGYTGQAMMVEPDPSREREGERPLERAVRRHWVWSEIWKVRSQFTPVLVAALVINLLAFALPLFTMNVYDRIIPNKSVPSLWVLSIGVGIAIGFELTMRLARARLIDQIGRKIDAKLSQKLFEKVMNTPLTTRSGSTGAFAKRLSEYELVRDFFASTTVVLAVDMVFVFLFLALIFVVAGPLVIVPIIGILFMLAAGFSLQKGMGEASRDAQADAGLQHSLLVESIGGLETLKAARGEGRMLGRWRRYADTSAKTQDRLRRMTAAAVNMASFCQQFITIGLIIGGFYLFNAGMISMGAIIAIVMLAGRALAPVGQFAFLMTRARQAIVTLQSLQTLMEADDERSLGVRSVSPSISNGEITFEHVGFKYPAASANSLSDVSLTIKPGERIGIIGRVASGKSTFGRVLCGLYPPSEGVYLIDGLDSRQYHAHEVRSAFRFVGQDAELFNGSVRDNLMIGARTTNEEALLEAVRKSGADSFLARDAAGFDLTVGERGGRLSGGQRSFLVLARSLVEPCKLLFLDEPTGAMDTQTERSFIEHLQKALDPRQTLVVSTHRHAMLSIVDRLIVIDKGRVIADGPRDSVIKALEQPVKKAG